MGYFKNQIETAGWRALSEAYYHMDSLSDMSGDVNGIINYHSVSANETDLFGNISPNRFERDLRYLTENFELVDLPRVLSDNYSNDKRIALTFDDGYENFYTDVFSILQKFDVPATVFINPSFIGDANRDALISAHSLSNPPSRIILNRSQIAELVESELVTIGNHTSTHVDLSTIEDSAELREEIVDSQTELERRFDINVNRFSYPYGGYSRSAVELVRGSHEIGVGTNYGLVEGKYNRGRVPRIWGHKPERMLRWELTDIAQRIRRMRA